MVKTNKNRTKQEKKIFDQATSLTMSVLADTKMQRVAIPDEVLVNIFSFVGDPSDLLICELACRDFHHVLSKDDRCWQQFIVDDEVRGISRRQQVFFQRTLPKIRQFQSRGRDHESCCLASKNTLIRTLGVDGFRAFVQECFRDLPVQFEIRGDTLGLVAEYIENFLTTKLRLAWEMVCSMTEKYAPREYPCLDTLELNLFDKIHFCNQPKNFQSVWHHWRGRGKNCLDPITILNDESLVSEEQKGKIVRRLAFDAGVAMYTYGAFRDIWYQVENVMMLLVHSAAVYFTDSGSHQFSHERGGDSSDIDMENDTPPVLKHSHLHVIVPGMIHAEARRMGFPRVLGDTWVASNGKTVSMECTEARKQYLTKSTDKDTMGTNYETIESQLEDDSDSQYESSEDDYSIYSDDDSPDHVPTEDAEMGTSDDEVVFLGARPFA